MSKKTRRVAIPNLWRARAVQCSVGDADPTWTGRWRRSRASAARTAAGWLENPAFDLEDVWIERWEVELDEPVRETLVGG